MQALLNENNSCREHINYISEFELCHGSKQMITYAQKD